METNQTTKTAGNMEYAMLASKHNPEYKSRLTLEPQIVALKNCGYKERQVKNTYHLASNGGDVTGVIEYYVFEKEIVYTPTPAMKTAGVRGRNKIISVIILPKPVYEMLILAQCIGGFDGFASYNTI